MLTTSTARPKDSVSAGLVAAGRAEQALWLLETLVPDSGVNNLSVVFEAGGRLGEWELQQTLTAVLARHEVLRTVFHAADFGLVKHVVDRERFAVEIETREFDEAAVAAFVAEPFAFDGRPLVRAACFRGETADVCCIVVHHIIFDTVSSAVLLDEFVQIYESVSAGLDVPEELAEVVQPLISAPAAEASLGYWREHLSGFDPTALGLSVGKDDIPEPTLTGDCVLHTLSPAARAALAGLQQQLRAPEAVILLAVYYLLLARHGAGPDLVVGSPADLRDRHAPRAIGYHVNTLPLRAEVDLGTGFRRLAARVREVFLGSITHADVPVDILLAEVGRRGGSWRNTFFRHGFNYVPDVGRETFEIDGMAARRLVVENGYSKLDLEFFFLSSPEAIRIRGVYYTEVLSRTDTELLLERYDELLVSLGADPDRPMGQIPLACARDRVIIDAANDTAVPVKPATLLEAVARTVAATPAAVAVQDGARRVSYAELWRTALATRDVLREAGTEPGDIVGLASPRSPELAAAALGVWLAAAAYLPLDPEHPAQRTAYLLRDSGAKAVLTAPGVTVPDGDRLVMRPMVPVLDSGAELTAGELAVTPDPDGTALLIYTSGSTGRPKGALITHRGEANAVYHHVDALRATADDATLWMVPFTFDPSGVELFLPLVSGGRIVVAPDAARTDGRMLLDLISSHGVGILQATPTTWRLVADEAGGHLTGVRAISGGEPLPVELARRITASGCELYNAYGPSETTICSTMAWVPCDATAIDVGSPIRNTQVFIVDEDGHELPVGVRGELCIAGAGLSAGYRGRPELTAERFVEHPRFGRCYRTGDLACWLPSGAIALHGRLDRQVKLRGNRIELGEVEAVLLGHADVDAAAVLVADGAAGGVLTAFVVAGPADAGLTDRLWAHAGAELPRAAVPQEFVLVEAIPVTANQKTDYAALRRIAERRCADRADTRPATAHQGDGLIAALVELWREVLDRPDVDADTNFFTHGGHSLLGTQLVQQVERRFGVDVRLAELFTDPTPAALAGLLRTAGVADAAAGTAD